MSRPLEEDTAVAGPVPLAGRRVRLRGLLPADVARRQRLGVHPRIARGYGQHLAEARELAAEEAQRWYDTRLEKADPLWWVIDLNGEMIGTTHLHSVSQQDRKARYAIGLMSPQYLGLGLGSETTRLVLAHAFDSLGLHRVDLRVLAVNTAAIAAYRVCGFVEEGRERDSCQMDGAWHDDVIMSILEHEYRAAQRGWTP